MKKIILVIFYFGASTLIFAQSKVILPKSIYEQMKLKGELKNNVEYILAEETSKETNVGEVSHVTTNHLEKMNYRQYGERSNCNCLVPLDSTFNIAEFSGYTPPDYRNDDASTSAKIIPFNFCLYGTNYNNFYINNNGNISFGSGYSTFTASGFPSNQYVMIAPFWGDVDTRNPNSGLVYYKITPTYVIVKWESVGYFDSYADKLNTFQLIISNGSDPIVSTGNNISFCYGDMSWTTGDASSGQNGFGGTPATVGVNKGDNVNYIQFGRFDQAGVTYDGPFNNSDGVSWLDNQYFSFNSCTSGSSNNIPPILNSAQICDTLKVCIGDTLVFDAQFFSPEQSQITTPSISAPGVNGFSILNSSSGNTASITAQLVASSANIGLNILNLVGTDDGTPVQSTSKTIYVEVLPEALPSFTVSPSVFAYLGESVTFNNTSSNCTNYLWNFGDGLGISTSEFPTYLYSSTGTYNVTLTGTSANGCVNTYTLEYNIIDDVVIPNVFSPNSDGKNDLFVIKNLEFFPNSKLSIFNRWGNKIYYSDNYQNNWSSDGASDGVYYYILEHKDLRATKTGFVQIVR